MKLWLAISCALFFAKLREKVQSQQEKFFGFLYPVRTIFSAFAESFPLFRFVSYCCCLHRGVWFIQNFSRNRRAKKRWPQHSFLRTKLKWFLQLQIKRDDRTKANDIGMGKWKTLVPLQNFMSTQWEILYVRCGMVYGICKEINRNSLNRIDFIELSIQFIIQYGTGGWRLERISWIIYYYIGPQ